MSARDEAIGRLARAFDDLEMQKIVNPRIEAGDTLDDVLSNVSRMRKLTQGRSGALPDITADEEALFRIKIPDLLSRRLSEPGILSRQRLLNSTKRYGNTNRAVVNAEDLTTLEDEASHWERRRRWDGPREAVPYRTLIRRIQEARKAGPDASGLYTISVPPSATYDIYDVGFGGYISGEMADVRRAIQEIAPGISDRAADALIRAYRR